MKRRRERRKVETRKEGSMNRRKRIRKSEREGKGEERRKKKLRKDGRKRTIFLSILMVLYFLISFLPSNKVKSYFRG